MMGEINHHLHFVHQLNLNQSKPVLIQFHTPLAYQTWSLLVSVNVSFCSVVLGMGAQASYYVIKETVASQCIPDALCSFAKCLLSTHSEWKPTHGNLPLMKGMVSFHLFQNKNMNFDVTNKCLLYRCLVLSFSIHCLYWWFCLYIFLIFTNNWIKWKHYFWTY